MKNETWYFEEQGDAEQRKLNQKLAVPLDYSSLCQVEIKTSWLLRLASLLPTFSEHNQYVSSPNSAPRALRFQAAGVSPSEFLVPTPAFLDSYLSFLQSLVTPVKFILKQ